MRENLTGKQFGCYKVLEPAEAIKESGVMRTAWKISCDCCGAIKNVRTRTIKRKKSMYCQSNHTDRPVKYYITDKPNSYWGKNALLLSNDYNKRKQNGH